MDDPSLSPEILLENLTVKATATMALRSVLAESGTDPASLQYVIGSGEEAIGDRYNRGGGNLAKAVAEASACINSTGADIKAFCCGARPCDGRRRQSRFFRRLSSGGRRWRLLASPSWV